MSKDARADGEGGSRGMLFNKGIFGSLVLYLLGNSILFFKNEGILGRNQAYICFLPLFRRFENEGILTTNQAYLCFLPLFRLCKNEGILSTSQAYLYFLPLFKRGFPLSQA